jgi:uncharacterized iron-regulated membrane protein
MGEMHNGVGLLLGTLLFVIFWTGTLSVFDKEIDRWMMPGTRLAALTGQTLSIDRDVRPIFERDAALAPAWTIILPSERTPFLALSYGSEQARKSTRRLFDPHDMHELPPALSYGASGFLYPFHHNLTIRQSGIGAWIVGIASVAMLCLLVSGIAAHRKILVEFFTFRPLRAFNRSSLDLHNLTGVLVLPFYVAITLSGLIVAFEIYFPKVHEALYTDATEAQSTRVARETPERAFLREAMGKVRLPKGGHPGDTASLDAMIASAEHYWGQGNIYLIRVNNPKDSAGNVVLRRHNSDSVAKDIDNIRFATTDGRLMGKFEASPMVGAWNFIAGMHYLQFSHWALRWLYFFAGLAGCVMIATGLLFWSSSRRKAYLANGKAGGAVVDTLNIAGIGGLIAATLAFFVANQVLPRQADIFGFEREQAEILIFFGTWLLGLAHAALRCFSQRQKGHLLAWHEVLLTIALLSLTAVAFNGIFTGDHLLRTLASRNWPVATMDALLLLCALLALLGARRIGLARSTRAPSHA